MKIDLELDSDEFKDVLCLSGFKIVYRCRWFFIRIDTYEQSLALFLNRIDAC